MQICDGYALYSCLASGALGMSDVHTAFLLTLCNPNDKEQEFKSVSAMASTTKTATAATTASAASATTPSTTVSRVTKQMESKKEIKSTEVETQTHAIPSSVEAEWQRRASLISNAIDSLLSREAGSTETQR